jgi:hypothetical protein
VAARGPEAGAGDLIVEVLGDGREAPIAVKERMDVHEAAVEPGGPHDWVVGRRRVERLDPLGH